MLAASVIVRRPPARAMPSISAATLASSGARRRNCRCTDMRGEATTGRRATGRRPWRRPRGSGLGWSGPRCRGEARRLGDAEERAAVVGGGCRSTAPP